MTATPVVKVAVPDGWHTVDEGAGVRRCGPPGAGVGAPSLVTTVVPNKGVPAETDLLEAVAQLGSVLSDAVLIDMNHRGDEAMILVAHEMAGVDLTTLQRRLVGPGHTAVAAVSVADGLWAAWEGPLRRMLATVEVDW